MTNFEHMDKDDLAETIADSGDRCRYCIYYATDTCDEFEPCTEGIRKWFDEESTYDD